MEKLSLLRFGFIGAFVNFIFVLIVEAFLWIKYVPQYNALFLSTYGVSLTPQIIKVFLISLIVGAVLGFILSVISAWIYNKLLNVKVA